MTREIKEVDWKLLRQLHTLAIERFCEGVLAEIEGIKADEAKSFHQRYLDIFALIDRRDKEIAQTFDGLRRSNAFFQLAAIKFRNLLTEDEFSRFSEETRSIIEMLLEASR